MSYRKVSKYGRIALGQLVCYSAAVLAPTNSARPGAWVRDQTTDKITHQDEIIGFSADGLVTGLMITETGCIATVTLPDGGQLRAHINCYGQDTGGFRGLRVLRSAPAQMEIAA